MKHVSYPPATNLQKGCFHLWMRQMAEAMNDSGQTLRKAIETNQLRLDVPWSEHNFKEIFLATHLDAIYGVESISDLDTKQITDLYEVMNENIASVFGVSLPFPSEDDL